MRPRSTAERAFLALGEEAEAFLREAHGADTLAAALRRAVEFRRFTAEDVRAILAAGPKAPTPAPPGQHLSGQLPAVPTRALDAYRLDTLRGVA